MNSTPATSTSQVLCFVQLFDAVLGCADLKSCLVACTITRFSDSQMHSSCIVSDVSFVESIKKTPRWHSRLKMIFDHDLFLYI